MGRNNTQLRPLTHKYNDPDGLSVRGLGGQAVPGGSCAACMELSGRNRVLYMSYRASHQEER
jgi:hypothetical protein